MKIMADFFCFFEQFNFNFSMLLANTSSFKCPFCIIKHEEGRGRAQYFILTKFNSNKLGQNEKLRKNARKKCANHLCFVRMNFFSELNCTQNSNNCWHTISTVQEVRLEFWVGSQQLQILTVFMENISKLLVFKR